MFKRTLKVDLVKDRKEPTTSEEEEIDSYIKATVMMKDVVTHTAKAAGAYMCLHAVLTVAVDRLTR